MSRRYLFAALFAAALACCLAVFSINSEWPKAAAQGAQLPTLALGTPLGGFASPVAVTHAGDGSGRLFVVEQGGRIRLVKDGVLQTAPFLNISTRISSGGERGLLGLAFPRDYSRKGHFYVYYTNPSGDIVIARYRVSTGNADLADATSEQVVITVPHPNFSNHNGGQLAFSPRDGFLYAGTGDGGSGGDPGNRAQNPADLLGKMLRLDTETGRPYTYTTPATNPFAAAAGFRPEIWALGVRNPWRFSFDRLTADLYMADVGQGNWEEVNFQPSSSPGGENYGWRIMEGTHCFNPPGCSVFGLTLPILEYGHGAGDCSVTGGYVYRAGAFPRMQGLYVYGDFCSGRIWALRRDGGGAWQNSLLLDTSIQISAFGEDEGGNLYVAGYGTGQIFPLVDAGQTPVATPTPTTVEVKFSSATFVTSENLGAASIAVTRSGDTSREIFVDYATSDVTATSRGDYTAARGTLRFAPGETQKSFTVLVSNDDTREGDEFFDVTLGNLVGNATLEAVPGRRVTITDDDAATGATNPLDRSDFFVRQHYLDFLSREPDAAGLAFWVEGIESCGADARCREVKRVDTSAAFFLSIEFQETGYLAYRLHKAAFGNVAGTPVPLRLSDFLRDTQELGRNVVVGQGDWRALLEQNKRGFVNSFVERAAFVSRYQTGQTPAQFVAALDANAGDVLTAAEEADLAARLADGRETRAGALRRVAEDEDFRRAEFNRAFVLMQYFGYLRRDPDAAPDSNFDGYNFWLAKLEQFDGNYIAAEMVKAFLSSAEYRQRFR